MIEIAMAERRSNDAVSWPYLKLGIALLLLLISSIAFAEINVLSSPSIDNTVDFHSLSGSELDAYLATLTDKESRELLLEQLKNQSEERQASESEEPISSRAIMMLQNRSEEVEMRIDRMRESIGKYSEAVGRTLVILFNVSGVEAIPATIAMLLMLIITGWLLTTLFFRFWITFRERLRQGGEFTVSVGLSRIATGLLHDILKIGFFIGLTVSLTLIFFDRQDPVRVLASTMVMLVASLWAINTLLKELLYSPVARNLFFTNDTDRNIYYWASIGFFVPSLVLLFSSGLLKLLGFPEPLIRVHSLILITIAMWSLIAGVVVYARLHSRRMVDGAGIELPGRVNWYWSIVLVFLFMWLIILFNIISVGEFPGARFNYFAVMLIMLAPLYDRLLQLLMSPQVFVSSVGSEFRQESLGGDFHERDSRSVAPNQFIRIVFSVPYMALIVLYMLEGMGLGIFARLEGDGGKFWQSIVEVVLAITLGAICWNAVKNYINKNLPEISIDPEALMDSEGGGSDVATRTQTLLPILRNFFLFFIAVTVVLIVLSSLGINTAPLLAGAGIIGIAIGFGAQKLVQDIVSGMFFLFEDAFRIGEYIESDTMVGTVESTSIRSLKLRHHLGPVQTVPYSEIRSVKNHSRDFIIMKLKFRVPFDTDIEVVRKTIKKVGQELLKHDELGPDFIAPLKSQGVLHVEDDALMMRMKFTSKPGKQWVIRREAYRLVKEALEAKGIKFAQRQVMVHISGKQNDELDEDSQQKIAGAASETSPNKSDTPDKPADPMADM